MNLKPFYVAIYLFDVLVPKLVAAFLVQIASTVTGKQECGQNPPTRANSVARARMDVHKFLMILQDRIYGVPHLSTNGLRCKRFTESPLVTL